jgi:hypothetical protein
MRKIYLSFVAATLVLVGLAYLVVPQAYLEGIGVAPVAGGALEAFRSFGGFYLGFAAWLVLNLRRKEPLGPALRSVILVMLGVLVGRVAGIAIDGLPDARLLVSASVELVFLAWGLALVKAKTEHDGAPHQPD